MIKKEMGRYKGRATMRSVGGYLSDPHIKHPKSKAKKKLRSKVRSLTK